MDPQLDAHKPHLKAFHAVMVIFQESYAASGSLGAMNYGKGAEEGKSTNSGSSQTVVPSVSDFNCDVEISARRCLDKYQLAYFKRYYVTGEVLVLSLDDPDLAEGDKFLEAHLTRFSADKLQWITDLDYAMRCDLGKRFMEVGVYPTEIYMKPVDVRDKKPSKTRWSHLYGN